MLDVLQAVVGRNIPSFEVVEVRDAAACMTLENEDVALLCERLGWHGCAIQRIAFLGGEIYDRAIAFGGYLVACKGIGFDNTIGNGEIKNGAQSFEAAAYCVGTQAMAAHMFVQALQIFGGCLLYGKCTIIAYICRKGAVTLCGVWRYIFAAGVV